MEDIRSYLITQWDASIANGYEADDAMAMEHTNDTVVCSIDKDLRQLQGWHYHFVDRKLFKIGATEALFNFYYQLLVGDPTDNIKGCPGIGKVKAPQILEGCTTEVEFYKKVYEAYQHAYKDEDEEVVDYNLELNAQLLYIRRHPEQGWKRPERVAAVESKSSGAT